MLWNRRKWNGEVVKRRVVQSLGLAKQKMQLPYGRAIRTTTTYKASRRCRRGDYLIGGSNRGAHEGGRLGALRLTRAYISDALRSLVRVVAVRQVHAIATFGVSVVTEVVVPVGHAPFDQEGRSSCHGWRAATRPLGVGPPRTGSLFKPSQQITPAGRTQILCHSSGSCPVAAA